MRYITLIFLSLQLNLAAIDDTPACFNSLAENFFDPTTVKKSFNLSNLVFQSQWDTIYREIALRKSLVLPRVRAKAKMMNPSPLERPFDGEKALELLLSEELNIFREALNSRLFKDEQAIRAMFGYIQSRKQEEIERCIPPKKVKK